MHHFYHTPGCATDVYHRNGVIKKGLGTKGAVCSVLTKRVMQVCMDEVQFQGSFEA